MAKRSLLLVDGDAKSLRVLEVSLKKAGFNVTTATSGAEAIETVQRSPPDLVISDTDMPGMDGYDFCRQFKANPYWSDIPFVFLTAKNEIEDKIKGLELGVDDYLTKPIYIKEILTRVRILLQKRDRTNFEQKKDNNTRFAGMLNDMGVVDLIQTIEVSRKTGVIHFRADEKRQATLFFKEGRVIDAEAGHLQGEDAVYRILTWNDGEFEALFRPVRRKAAIEISSQALLMEGMRRLDEWGRLQEQLPPLNQKFEVVYDELWERLADLPDDLNQILRLFDSKRTLAEVIDNANIGDLEAVEIISKLYFEGIIVEAGSHVSGEIPIDDLLNHKRRETDEGEGAEAPASSSESSSDIDVSNLLNPRRQKAAIEAEQQASAATRASAPAAEEESSESSAPVADEGDSRDTELSSEVSADDVGDTEPSSESATAAAAAENTSTAPVSEFAAAPTGTRTTLEEAARAPLDPNELAQSEAELLEPVRSQDSSQLDGLLDRAITETATRQMAAVAPPEGYDDLGAETASETTASAETASETTASEATAPQPASEEADRKRSAAAKMSSGVVEVQKPAEEDTQESIATLDQASPSAAALAQMQIAKKTKAEVLAENLRKRGSEPKRKTPSPPADDETDEEAQANSQASTECASEASDAEPLVMKEEGSGPELVPMEVPPWDTEDGGVGRRPGSGREIAPRQNTPQIELSSKAPAVSSDELDEVDDDRGVPLWPLALMAVAAVVLTFMLLRSDGADKDASNASKVAAEAATSENSTSEETASNGTAQSETGDDAGPSEPSTPPTNTETSGDGTSAPTNSETSRDDGTPPGQKTPENSSTDSTPERTDPKPDRADPKPEPKVLTDADKAKAALAKARRARRSGDRLEALHLIDESLDLQRSSSAELLKAEILLDMGDSKSALRLLQPLSRKLGGRSQVWRLLGKSADDQGDKTTAKSAYSRYLDLAPDARDAADIRRRLQKL